MSVCKYAWASIKLQTRCVVYKKKNTWGENTDKICKQITQQWKKPEFEVTKPLINTNLYRMGRRFQRKMFPATENVSISNNWSK